MKKTVSLKEYLKYKEYLGKISKHFIFLKNDLFFSSKKINFEKKKLKETNFLFDAFFTNAYIHSKNKTDN